MVEGGSSLSQVSLAARVLGSLKTNQRETTSKNYNSETYVGTKKCLNAHFLIRYFI